MTGISRRSRGAASWLCLGLAACGGRAASGGKRPTPAPARVIPFASAIVEVTFAGNTFHADSGRPVKVEIRPRPGVYGIDLVTSAPFSEGASVVFKYPRYFSAPAKARAVYGSDVLYERALAIGQLVADGQSLALLPSTRPASDNLQAALPGPGTYLVAAPESP
jgi:hypothetical protein